MLQACGITGFLLPVERTATARVKDHPEDFIVVEIDPTGTRTDAVGYRLPIPSAPGGLLNTDGSLQETSDITAAATASAARADHNSLASAVDDQSLADGVEGILLSNAVQDALFTTFGGKHDAIAHYRLAVSTEEEESFSSSSREYFIGVFNSREDRKRVHHTLKTQFPHLRTETRRMPSLQGNEATSDFHVFAIYDLDYLFLASCLDEHAADAVEQWNATEPSSRSSFIVTASFSKDATKATRRSFHKMLSRRYPDIICRVTNGLVTLTTSRNQRGKRLRSGGNDNYTGTTSYIHILIRKRNLDMMELRMLLAEHFNIPDTAVCSAGMKDKCAVTYQRCSVPAPLEEGKHGDSCREITRLTWPSDPYSYVEILQISDPCMTPVQVGQLNGNWFSIRLLDVSGISQAELTQRLQRIESDGFLNYFGQQRFSENVRSVTDHVGIHLLAGRWTDAVRGLLCGAPGLYDSFPEKMEVRHVPANARDAQCIVHALRRVYHAQDVSLSNPLSSEDVVGCTPRWQQLCHDALLTVPYAFRVLWIHAAQSLIFNMMLSKLSAAQTSLESVKSLPLVGYQATVEDTVRPFLEQTLSELHLRVDDVFQQKKVLGVSLPGAIRQTIVRPRECTLVLDSEEEDKNKEEEGEEKYGFSASLSFSLPPSSYATIFLREVLGCDKWW